MIYDALEVSRHIVNYCNDSKYGMTNLKLQKLLYFIQAYSLIKRGRPCFNDEIEAWDFGPVVPSVYHEYKRYGAFYIFSIKTYIEFDKSNSWNMREVEYKDNIINEKDKKLINEVVNAFSNYSASDLVSLTHAQDPWKNAYKSRQSNVITKKAIEEFFNGKK